MSIITGDRLKQFAISIQPGIVQAFADHADDIDKAGLTSPLRVQHFMAEIAVETWSLTRLEENLMYSAKRLVEVWPKRFPTLAAAMPFANNPKALANKAYGGRLGNHLPDDGWTYRGSGMLQTTGRDNFRAAGHEDDPDTLRQPDGALLSALKYWTDHNINRLADDNNLYAVRKAVNGGTIGLSDAKNYFSRAKRIFV